MLWVCLDSDHLWWFLWFSRGAQVRTTPDTLQQIRLWRWRLRTNDEDSRCLVGPERNSPEALVMHACKWKAELKRFVLMTAEQSTPVNCVSMKWIICTVTDMLDVSCPCFLLSDNPDERLIIVYYKLRHANMGQNVLDSTSCLLLNFCIPKGQIQPWWKPKKNLNILTLVLFSAVRLKLTLWNVAVFLTCKMNASMKMFDKIKSEKCPAWAVIASVMEAAAFREISCSALQHHLLDESIMADLHGSWRDGDLALIHFKSLKSDFLIQFLSVHFFICQSCSSLGCFLLLTAPLTGQISVHQFSNICFLFS